MARTQTRNPLAPVRIKVIPRAQVERNRERHRRYNRKRPRKTGVLNSERPFIFWDGEGPQDAGYALFGSSNGDEICHPFLSTSECLDLLLACERDNPDAIHIAFGFNYDASMILHELPWRCLNALKVYGATWWHEYEIEHIPHKWFKVSKDGITAQVFDIRNFFPGSYLGALDAMGIGTGDERAIIAEGKAGRAIFRFADIDNIRRYWRTELKLGPELAGKLRESFLGAGFDLRSWHGPGALARMALDKHGVANSMADTPYDVREAARYAFAGGRFEMVRGGHVQGKVYNADIRSAYPGFARNLPNLARGTWRYGRDYETGKFAIYHIVYNSPITDPLHIHPLFRRESNGVVQWPNHVEGWYHAPEAALVQNDSSAVFLEAWIFDEDDETDRPFAWIEEYYERRQFLKRMGNPLELTFKLVINSVYGQLAQRSGWDRKHRKAPRTHQLEWAGYITSACRAHVYRIAAQCGDKLVSIDTDGIYSMAPIPVVAGTRLGEWELNEYDEGIFWQSGIYCLRTNDKGWEKGRTRGIPKGAYTPGELLTAMESDERLHLTVHTFVGYGLALNSQYDRWNRWSDDSREIVFGGQGKRYHNVPLYCRKGKCPGNGIHNFIPPPDPPKRSYRSVPHYLPWLHNNPALVHNKLLIGDYIAYNENDIDEDELWERSDRNAS